MPFINILNEAGFIFGITIFTYLFFSLLIGLIGQIMESKGTLILGILLAITYCFLNIFSSSNFISIFTYSRPLNKNKISTKNFLEWVNKDFKQNQ